MTWIETVIGDLWYGARMFLHQPGTTVLAVVALSLGIGANAVVYSLLHAVLLRPLPFRDAERLVAIVDNYRTDGARNVPPTVPEVLDVRAASQHLQGISFFDLRDVQVTGGTEPARAFACARAAVHARGPFSRPRSRRHSYPRFLAAELRGKPGCDQSGHSGQRCHEHRDWCVAATRLVRLYVLRPHRALCAVSDEQHVHVTSGRVRQRPACYGNRAAEASSHHGTGRLRGRDHFTAAARRSSAAVSPRIRRAGSRVPDERASTP
jgi:hypothetical protein